MRLIIVKSFIKKFNTSLVNLICHFSEYMIKFSNTHSYQIFFH